MAVLTGFEPAIFCVTGRRDKPLHYRTNGCGGRIRTNDLWVMSPTSYQLLHSAIKMNNEIKWRRKQDSNPRALSRLSVFKTDPFSQTWVFLRINSIQLKIQKIILVDPAGLEPATDRL